MDVRKLVGEVVRAAQKAAAVDGVVSVGTDRGRSTSRSVSSRRRIVQQGGRTIVDEHDLEVWDEDRPATRSEHGRRGTETSS